MGRAVGGLIGNTPMICGGLVEHRVFDENWNDGGKDDVNIDKCYVLKNKQWIESSMKLTHPSCDFGTGSVVVEDKLLVSGGRDFLVLPNPEFDRFYWINEEEKSDEAFLPSSFRSHCNILINSTLLLQTGGVQNCPDLCYPYDEVKEDTYFYDISSGQWREGKRMKLPRQRHGCSQVTVGGKQIAIVAGGMAVHVWQWEYQDKASPVDSFEYLQMDDIEKGWIKGPKKLPFKGLGFVMVTSFDNMRTYITGGPYILEFVCDKPTPEECYFQNKLDGGQLMKERIEHIAFPIPDYLVNELCE